VAISGFEAFEAIMWQLATFGAYKEGKLLINADYYEL
jgi:hypothetical protein